MDSFGNMKRDARDFHHVYVRRRRVVRDLDLNIPFGSESSMLETDVSLEIGDDGFAAGNKWRCPTYLKIDDDEVSMPIKYVKKLKSKKGIASAAPEIGTNSNVQAKLAVIDNQV